MRNISNVSASNLTSGVPKQAMGLRPGACEIIGPLFSRVPACGSGCPAVDNGARLGSISMSLRVARCRGFLKAHAFSGSARTTYGRDLRKRKLSWRNSRRHCRTPNLAQYNEATNAPRAACHPEDGRQSRPDYAANPCPVPPSAWRAASWPSRALAFAQASNSYFSNVLIRCCIVWRSSLSKSATCRRSGS